MRHTRLEGSMTFPGFKSRRSLIDVNERDVTALVDSFTCGVEKSANKDEFGMKLTRVKCHGKLVAETTAEMKGVVHPLIPLWTHYCRPRQCILLGHLRSGHAGRREIVSNSP